MDQPDLCLQRCFSFINISSTCHLLFQNCHPEIVFLSKELNPIPIKSNFMTTIMQKVLEPTAAFTQRGSLPFHPTLNPISIFHAFRHTLPGHVAVQLLLPYGGFRGAIFRLYLCLHVFFDDRHQFLLLWHCPLTFLMCYKDNRQILDRHSGEAG